eukprot:13734395-Ditylum_brightwellii.AAC.1
MLVDFIGEPRHFLGIKFEVINSTNNVTVFLSQETSNDDVIKDLNLLDLVSPSTPYRSDDPVDNIPVESSLPKHELELAQQQLQSIV